MSPAKNKLATKASAVSFLPHLLAKVSHMTEPDSHWAGKYNPHSESGGKTDTSGKYHHLQTFLLFTDLLLVFPALDLLFSYVFDPYGRVYPQSGFGINLEAGKPIISTCNLHLFSEFLSLCPSVYPSKF